MSRIGTSDGNIRQTGQAPVSFPPFQMGRSLVLAITTADRQSLS
ncbi:MAG: hypothetical protein WBE13_11745 [Candidatus Acidiferrum sp.]